MHLNSSVNSAVFHRSSEAARANIYALGGAADGNFDSSDIGLPLSVGVSVGVRNIAAKGNALAAVITFCHLLSLRLI